MYISFHNPDYSSRYRFIMPEGGIRYTSDIEVKCVTFILVVKTIEKCSILPNIFNIGYYSELFRL